METRLMPESEIRAISDALEDNFSSVFYKFWSMGTPIFTTAVPTAAVSLSITNNTCIQLLLNPEFWDSLSFHNKCFVICHEALHLLFDHFQRCHMFDKFRHEKANICQDISINHKLVSGFGFDRTEIDADGKFCWVDTVFKVTDENPILPSTENFEYYLNKLEDENVPNNIKYVTLVDVHGYFDINGQPLDPSDVSAKVAQAMEAMDISYEEFEELMEKSRGTEGGNCEKLVQVKRPKPKNQWLALVRRKFLRKFKSEQHPKEKPFWMKSRKYYNLPSNILLPEDRDEDIIGKYEAYVFLDTSGSCVSYAEKFWKLSATIPRKSFVVKLHCFDTKVYPLTEKDVENKTLYGFGGTSFKEIEDYLLTLKKYPDFVFVITDGYGGNLVQKHHDRWSWILTDGINFPNLKGEKVPITKFD